VMANAGGFELMHRRFRVGVTVEEAGDDLGHELFLRRERLRTIVQQRLMTQCAATLEGSERTDQLAPFVTDFPKNLASAWRPV
jgi:hypothetical protein